MSVRTNAALVVGGGYLGARVAKELRAAGLDATASARSDAGLERIAREGIEPLRLDLASLPDSLPKPYTAIVYAVSKGRDGDGEIAWREGPRRVLDLVASNPPERFVFVSSTGVHGTSDGSRVDEATPATSTEPSHRAIRDGEEIVLRGARGGPPGIVVRAGGLYGPDRSPIDWIRRPEFRARLGAGGRALMNWIHVDDAAKLVASAAIRGRPGAIYLAVDGAPVERREFWRFVATLAGVEPPVFADDDDRGKRCDPTRTFAELEVTPRFDWRTGLESLSRGGSSS
ncbi:MAG TPA: NAD-dependent epimerase/dehydratase family protein [Planctomycetota bacterium]|nr:NAD-dependent epimerase/dehydratase family protein [Planctomycetota bacterium]